MNLREESRTSVLRGEVELKKKKKEDEIFERGGKFVLFPSEGWRWKQYKLSSESSVTCFMLFVWLSFSATCVSAEGLSSWQTPLILREITHPEMRRMMISSPSAGQIYTSCQKTLITQHVNQTTGSFDCRRISCQQYISAPFKGTVHPKLKIQSRFNLMSFLCVLWYIKNDMRSLPACKPHDGRKKIITFFLKTVTQIT